MMVSLCVHGQSLMSMEYVRAKIVAAFNYLLNFRTVKEEYNVSSLFQAIHKGDFNSVQDILYSGVDPNGKDNLNQARPYHLDDHSAEGTPLHLAASNGRADIIFLLVLAGADCDAPNARNQTALHIAAKGGHADAVQALLEAGANKNQKDIDENIAIHLALQNGHQDVADILERAGSNIYLRNAKGFNAHDLRNRKDPEFREHWGQKGICITPLQFFSSLPRFSLLSKEAHHTSPLSAGIAHSINSSISK